MAKLPDAWRQTHATTATKRAKAVAKVCATPGCGAGLMNRRKTYCGPCYDARLQSNIAANRWRYRSEQKHYKTDDHAPKCRCDACKAMWVEVNETLATAVIPPAPPETSH